MKIVVLGAGAVGSVIGGLLKRSGEDVYLIRTNREWTETINLKGLTISEDGKADINVLVPAATDPAVVGGADLVVVMTKTPNTRDALKNASRIIGPSTLVLTLQNGLGNAEKIAEFVDPANIIIGTTTISAMAKAPGHVENMRHMAGTMNYIRKWQRSNSEDVQRVASTFTAAGMGTEILEDLDQLLWKKLLMHTGIAALAGITRLNLADLLAVSDAQELIRALIAETMAVANAKGVALDLQEELEHAQQVFLSTGPHINSMCYDMTHGRKTEIDSSNLAVAAEAERMGLAAPYNKAIGLLVRVIEQTYDKRL
ncbi:MAG: 2-dehydropantoate 2-reductase [Chloroflexota bacterium]|nr:MAG: 2-dehydropantoate 2-reductase [Chloroflexota bacterium]